MVDFLALSGQGHPALEPARAFAPAEVLSRLSSVLGESPELSALAQERNPELFYESLLNYAGRLGRHGRHAESQAVLEVVAGGSEASVAGRARRRIDALQGVGDIGARTEVLFGRFAREATEPVALASMGGAGALYRVTRFALLARLSSGPAGLLTRGFGARALASTLAFSAEASAFPMIMRAGHAALGHSQEWSAELLGHEIASSFFALGGLKLAGAGAGSLVRRLGQGNAAAFLGPLFRQTAMLGGIIGGHRLEEWAGLRPQLDGATTMVDSLALLLQFNVAGRLSQGLFGPSFRNWEMEVDRRSQSLGSNLTPHWASLRPVAIPHGTLAMASGPRPELPLHDGISLMEGSKFESSNSNRSSGPRLPHMGLRGDSPVSAKSEGLNRKEAERVLRELIPRGLEPERLENPGVVESLLNAFGVTSHAFDVQSFRDGYRIAQRHPERVARLAFDFDEVTLHWAFSPRDIFQVMAKGAEGAYFHTSRRVLEYDPLPATPGQGMNRFERIWFEGLQRLFPMAFRQHIQFHPGMRAFQLGLRFGQGQNLIMVTVGPSGRLMRLANEDAALKMIYFGRLPSDEISIEDVRGSTNIYTREDFVQALRVAESGEIRFPRNAQFESYLEILRNHPNEGNRIKHPVLALLRAKRPFDTLADDSSFALKVLGSLPGFTVLQVPSARPAATKNFTFGSVDAYLERSANGYVSALAERLAQDEWSSGPVENRPTPEGYKFQRLAVQIPWTEFGGGYVALGKEARARGRALAEGRVLEAPAAAVTDPSAPLSLTEVQSRLLVDRLYREFDTLLDGRPGEVSIEAANTLMLQEMAAASLENFQATLDTYLTPGEQFSLPQASLPLAERGQDFYSRVASLMAVKTAVCNLLALDVAEHAKDIIYRHGRPTLNGVAASRLNGNSMLTTLSDEGEVGVGIALIEPSNWASGLVGIGIDITTERASHSAPERHALSEAAYKAVYPAMVRRDSGQHHSNELSSDPNGTFSLSGDLNRAARGMRGDSGMPGPLPIRSLSFQVGRATVGLAAIPALPQSSKRPSFAPRPFNFPYRIDEDGRYQLPRPGMTVAVLGDVQAFRTLDLVRRGHFVVHIERDPDMAELAELMVQTVLRDESSIGRSSDTSVMRADWYSSAANADLVEAYFPLHNGDIPTRQEPGRGAALREFLDHALNSKLSNGGHGFVISEFRELIQDLAATIGETPGLQVLEERYSLTRPPIVGGYSLMMEGRQPVHYLVYRKGDGENSR
jgi:hypothetical protein